MNLLVVTCSRHTVVKGANGNGHILALAPKLGTLKHTVGIVQRACVPPPATSGELYLNAAALKQLLQLFAFSRVRRQLRMGCTARGRRRGQVRRPVAESSS